MNVISSVAIHSPMKEAIKGLALSIALMALFIATAHAEGRQSQRGRPEQNHGRPMAIDRDWDNHQGQARRYWKQHHRQPAPGYVYAPPLVYAPQPEYYTAPGINLIIPLSIH